MPVGSIVKIKGSFKKYIIIGFKYEANNKIYDYLFCEYPFGIDSNHKTHMFNHEEIEKIFHIGFINHQEKSFKADLIDDEEIER